MSEQNGFDYLLTYSDDPQTVFPRYCVSWMVSSGERSFLVKMSTKLRLLYNHGMESDRSTSSFRPTGMPDFLEKLHTAALKAKNMNVGVQDYVSVVKPPQITQERLGADNTHTAGPNQIYA